MNAIPVAVLQARYEAGESTAVLAAEVGLSRVQLWRVIGRPARYMLDRPATPDPITVAWAAGFFDGEGNVHLDTDGGLHVGAAQTVHEPLFALQRAFGGTVRDRAAASARHRHQWFWRLSGWNAVEFLRFVRPHLRVKGRQADLAIAALARPQRRGRRLTAEERGERYQAHLAMKALNQRGRT